MTDPTLDEDALTAAHKAVEDVLVEFRDRRISVLHHGDGRLIGNGLTTREGLRIGIKAYLAHLDAAP